MVKHIYPFSRISSSGQCKMCRGTYGNFRNQGLVSLHTEDESEVKLMVWSCDYCGFTMLFNTNVVENTPYRGDGEEEIPDFNKKGLPRDMWGFK